MGVTSVTLGNFFTEGTGSDQKTILGGAGGSGLDTQALINSLVTEQSAPITQDQDQIKVNNTESAALTQFQTLLSTFQSSVDALRNPPGVGNAASNVFDFTTGSVGNGGSNYISVTTSPGAALQTYDISNITSLASSASQSSGTFDLTSADNADATSSTSGGAYFVPGTITFAGGATVTVSAGDSLDEIAANFNAVSGSTGISATVIQQDSTHYQLSFTATSTGTDGNFDLSNTAYTNHVSGYTGNPTVSSGESVLAHLGFTTTTDDTTTSNAVAGTNASFDLNGVPITRQSNSVSDVIDGVTFNLLQTTTGDTSYPITVSPDTTTIQNSIVNFVNAYNALKTFATQQTQLNSNGTYASTAVLAGNQTFLQTMDDINTDVIDQVAGITGSNPKSLADIGITYTNQPATSTTPQVNNILTVNDGDLTSELSSNFNGVKNLFGINFTSSNPSLALYSDSNSLTATQFTLSISGGGSIFTASGAGLAPVTLTATPISGGGYSLTGPSGSALDGLEMIYAGTATSGSISVSITHGIADQAYNTTNAATTANTGTLAVAQQAIQSDNTSLNTDITRVQTLVNQYQQQLLTEFSALEQAISQTNSLLQGINANQNAALVQAGQ